MRVFAFLAGSSTDPTKTQNNLQVNTHYFLFFSLCRIFCLVANKVKGICWKKKIFGHHKWVLNIVIIWVFFFFFWNEEDNTRARVPKSPGARIRTIMWRIIVKDKEQCRVLWARRGWNIKLNWKKGIVPSLFQLGCFLFLFLMKY